MLRQSARRAAYRYGAICEARSRLHTGVRTRVITGRAGQRLPTLSKFALFGAATATLWYNYSGFGEPIMNDAETEENKSRATRVLQKDLLDDRHLNTIAWGSNKESLISSTAPETSLLYSPSAVPWLIDVALRDLSLHERHGVCVDARGDVYQWNAQTNVPIASLTGKDIINVQATPSHVFALSASGRVYALPSKPSSDTNTTESTSTWFSFLSPSGSRSSNYVELSTEQHLGRGEKFVSISAGNNHLLALTSLGRTFAHPINKNANTYGQLGYRKFTRPSPSDPSNSTSRIPAELIPKAILDPHANRTRNQRIILDGLPAMPIEEGPTNIIETDDVRFCDRLFEIPSLKGIKIVQAVAGARTSFARSDDGRVLAWGANEHGQLGLGSTMTVDTITIPTEVIFSKTASARTRSRCVDINSGGDLVFFTVERLDGTSVPVTDLLACGMGQWGGLGTGVYTTAQGEPARVKTVSGLLEYSEETQRLQSITPHSLSVSPSGHVLLTLDTRTRAGPGAVAGGARDVLSWGAGHSYQLGRGKRASSAIPAPLELVPSGSKGEAAGGSGSERFMLARRRAREVLDLSGRRWGKNVEVEQVAVAGWESSLVYWRVCRS